MEGINVQITRNAGGGVPVSYALERNINSAGWTTIEAALAYSSSPQTYQDSNGGAGFSVSDSVQYRATATNTDGTSSASTIQTHVVTAVSLAAPSGLTDAGGETNPDTEINLSWTNGAVYTEVRAYVGGVLQQTFTGNVTTGTLIGLTASTPYNSITVRGYDGTTESADNATPINVTTEAGTVVNLYPTGTPASPVPNEGSTIPTGTNVTPDVFFVLGSKITFTQDSVDYDNGTSSLKVEDIAGTGYSNVIWQFNVTIGSTYTITFRAKPSRTNSQVRSPVGFTTTTTVAIPTVDTWQDVTLVTDTATATGLAKIYFDITPSSTSTIGDTLRIDNLVIVEN